MAETMELQDSAVDRLDGKEQLSKDEEKYLNELKEKQIYHTKGSDRFVKV